MLIPCSFRISQNVIQASLGDSQRWIVEGERGIAYIDGCPNEETALFEQRLAKLGIQLNGRQAYRLFTSDDAARLYFPPDLTKRTTAIIPNRVSSNQGRKHSPPGAIEFSTESAALDLGGVAVRRIALGLATPSSAAYLIEPDSVLLADQSLGFYRGRELPAPGAGAGLVSSVSTLRDFAKMSIAALGLPWSGALTGALASQHINNVALITEELLKELRAKLEADKSEVIAKLSLDEMVTELCATLYFIPEDFIKSPSNRHTAVLKAACQETCRALLNSIELAN